MYGQPQYQQQNPQPQQPAAPMSLDSVMSGGVPSAFSKDDPIGTSVTGEIISIEAQQQTDFTTGAPLFFPNGNPKPQVVIHLKTSLHDPAQEYDDGVRSIYVKGYNIKTLRIASQQAGVGNWPRVGDRLTATFSGTQPAKQRGYNDAKLYSYQIVPGSANKAALDAAMADPYAGQPAQTAPSAQPMQYSQPQQFQQPAQPAGPTPQQATQIYQLKAAGRTPNDIAGMLGLTVAQVLAVADAANPGMHAGSEDTEF